MLSAVVNRPTSVSGFAAGSRADKSPAAIASAVSSTCSNGFRPSAIIHLEAKAIASNAITPKVKNKNLIDYSQIFGNNYMKLCLIIIRDQNMIEQDKLSLLSVTYGIFFSNPLKRSKT